MVDRIQPPGNHGVFGSGSCIACHTPSVEPAWEPPGVRGNTLSYYMGKLLVGTILPDVGPLSRTWLNLQLEMLARTTEYVDHFTVVSSGIVVDTKHLPGSNYIVPERTDLVMGQAHQQGLNILADLFRAAPDEYDGYLILDCDAFPLRKGWHELLEQKMVHHDVAMIVRAENLEKRFHASVCYAKRRALPYLAFHPDVAGLDWAGDEEFDLQCPHYQENPDKVFSLMRSNRYNIHPLACGIYYDCFYHHGCGSGRTFYMRSQNYWSHLELKDPADHLNSLFSDPDGFLASLR